MFSGTGRSGGKRPVGPFARLPSPPGCGRYFLQAHRHGTRGGFRDRARGILLHTGSQIFWLLSGAAYRHRKAKWRSGATGHLLNSPPIFVSS